MFFLIILFFRILGANFERFFLYIVEQRNFFKTKYFCFKKVYFGDGFTLAIVDNYRYNKSGIYRHIN